MSFPAFFDEIPRIALYDPLAEFLGAAEGGRLEYGYADAVRLAGHSCPTVAMSYALAWKGLNTLYPDRLPERGAVQASFPRADVDGVTGVVSAVVGLLTGATERTGFKGIGGRFARHGLMRFDAGVPGTFRLQRTDDGSWVDLHARLDRVPAAPRSAELLPRCLSGAATADEREEFRALWQGRVRALLIEHWDDAQLWEVARGMHNG